MSNQAQAVPEINARLRKRDVSRTYTGPDRNTLPSRSQQEKFFQRVANENILPTRAHKWLGFGGWVLGGIACGYMVLYADYGPKEHVFSPVRRAFDRYTSSMFTLSASERTMMGLEDPYKNASVRGKPTTPS